MKRIERWRLGLVTMATMALGALLMASSTRWLIASQLALQIATSASLPGMLRDLGVPQPPGYSAALAADRASRRKAISEFAGRHPDDYPVQLAAAEVGASDPTSGPAVVARLRDLLPRFPSNASLRAQILRYSTWGEVRVRRDEESLLGDARVPPVAPRDPPPAPETLAAFDRDAGEGERLDPDNAYFPLMRAVALFAAHRDAEALAAIRRAGGKLRCDDYVWHAAEGQWRLARLALGERGAIHHLETSAAVLFPHFAPLRAVARVATYNAVEAERAGRIEAGLAIRRSLMRCGALMRVHSRSFIGSLVGRAIVQVSMTRPGGGPPVRRPTGVPAEQRTKRRNEEYLAYLRQVGHGDEAAWVRRELDAGEQVRTLASSALPLTLMGGRPLMNLLSWWSAGLLTLSNILGMLGLALAAALLARLGRDRGAAPVIVVLGLLVAFGTVAWQARFNETAGAIWQAITQLAASDTGATATKSRANALLALVALKPVGVALAIAVPLVTVGIAGLVSLYSSEGLGAGLVRRLRSVAVPVACLLTLLYGGVLLETADQERRVHRGMDRMIQHEGRYMAELVGQPWPDVTR